MTAPKRPTSSFWTMALGLFALYGWARAEPIANFFAPIWRAGLEFVRLTQVESDREAVGAIFWAFDLAHAALLAAVEAWPAARRTLFELLALAVILVVARLITRPRRTPLPKQPPPAPPDP